ncbi:MAG: aminotransferase class I/II-fold pyridoxal phosphate-dependent enzyme [Gammaproteobacteria bacterium]|nr:aminotransferase class I/II-fold pyridoxal phosphate-dependent enzyme [Gammaproteobacteria bacterium]MDH3448634.1 aminotransferase class I/II-fold pyridoxal phosphate-dependent enzyme [Gammaproteobacteria bacterium]
MALKSTDDKGIQTLAIHAGESPDPTTGASTPGLVMSSSFVVDEEISFSANNLSAETPFVYTRWDNPTTQRLEQKLAVLEQAEAAIAFASGMAASAAVLLAHLSQGDHLVISNTNYPGTAEFARNTLGRLGIEVTPVDTSASANIESAMRENTRMLWLETPSNPLLRISDIAAAATIAHANDALLVVDSTFATPIATRPIRLGADLVVHSLTKYIGGHGDAMGGSVCGSRALIGPLRGEALVHYGGVISPFNAWLIMRGMATLPLRMRCHEHNAIAVANHLERHDQVEMLLYPGLESHPQHRLASAQMDNFCGMICFRTAAPRRVARRMMQQLEVIHYAVSLGHHRSLIYLMQTDDLIGSSYCLDGDELDRYRAVAGDGLFRLSVGLEDAADLIADLDRVLG